MTVSVWQEVTEPIQAEHDDVVIGAGIVGAYTATYFVNEAAMSRS